MQLCVFANIVTNMTTSLETITNPYLMALNAFSMIMHIITSTIYEQINKYNLTRYLFNKYNYFNNYIMKQLIYTPIKTLTNYGIGLATKLLLRISLPPINNVPPAQKRYNLEVRQEFEEFLDSLY